MSRLVYGLVFCVLWFNQASHTDVYGSDVAVSVLPAIVAPAAPVIPNRIASFGWTQNGFTLTNNATSLLFDSVFPVSGNIQMNGGTLTLHRDLIFNNLATLQGLGSVFGAGHRILLSPSIHSLPLDTQLFDTTKIVMNSDISIKSAVTFQSTGTDFCSIEGNGHVLTLADGSSIHITGTLRLHNVIIEGINNLNVQCSSDDSVLILDTVTWIQTDTYTFTTGSFECKNNVILRGSGTAFSYQSDQPSLINAYASLVLDSGLTFNYNPSIASETLINFADSTASLVLNSATFQTTSTSISLTKGSLLVHGVSNFVTNSSITLGDGLIADDMAAVITGGSSLAITTGLLNYNNRASGSWIMENTESQLDMHRSTTLALYDSMNLGSGQVILADQTILRRVETAYLLGSVTTLGTTLFQII